MTRRPTGLATLLAAVLSMAGCSGTSSASEDGAPEDTGALVGQTCADLVVIGARGSTQALDRNLGVGTEVRRTVTELTRRLHARGDATVRLEAVRYDSAAASSLAAYQSHVDTGAAMVSSRLESLSRSCPDTRFALVGFSQGAQVLHTATVAVPRDLARRIPLVAMIADPRRNPTDRIVQWSYAPRPTTGNGRLGSGAPIDPDLRAAAISLCVEGDEICNDRGAPGGPPSDTHKYFYQQPASVRATAEQLDRVLRRNGL
ncbi:MAG: cutinase family protein [Aeromicrobium sp.]